jgi:cytochrome P450
VSTSTLDLYDPVFHADPYPTYAALREQSPLLQLVEPAVWLMSRYEDVNDALRSPDTYSSRLGVAFHDGAGDGSLVAADDPDHARLRQILNKQFTPRSIAVLETEVDVIVAEVLAKLPASGPIDFATTVATEVPTRVVATYLGIDPDRWAEYKYWSDSVNDLIWSKQPTVEILVAANDGGTAAITFFTEQIAARRETPSSDLIGRLVKAGDAITDHEIIQFCFLLLLAGNVTTSSVLNHSVLLLLQHPEQLKDLQNDPELISQAIEEVVRFESPLQGFMRTLTRDVEMHGVTMREGDKVMMLYGSANRDASAHDDPDRFDIRRAPANHLAFGAGPHYCLGSWLARLEVRLVLRQLLPTLGTWQLDPERLVQRKASPVFRDVDSLPVVIGGIA